MISVDKTVLDAGVVVTLIVVVVGPMVAVMGVGLRWIGKAGLAMANALESLRKSNDRQNELLQDLTARQLAGIADVKNLGEQLSELTDKIHKLPPDIQRGVTDALDSFLDKLAEALRKTPGVPPDFSLRPTQQPVSIWARLFGLQ